MGSMTTLLVTFASTVGGILVGLLLRRILPQQHLRDDSKDVLKLGAGVIATLSALVLGLLVGSAKSSFDSVNSLIVQMGRRSSRSTGRWLTTGRRPRTCAIASRPRSQP